MKKWLGLLVAVAFVFVILGCAGDEETSGTPSQGAGSEVEEAAQEAAGAGEGSAAETSEEATDERRERVPGTRQDR